MSDEGEARRERTGRERTGDARMSGSGSRDGFGVPPWGPAEPAPALDETQAIPGLGTLPGPDQDAPQRNGWQRQDTRQQDQWQRGGSQQNGSQQNGSQQNGSHENGWHENGWHENGWPPPGTRQQDTWRQQDGGQQDTRDAGDNSGQPGPGQEDPGGGIPGGGAHRRRPKRRRSFWRELPVLIVVALVLALLIKSFVIQAFFIPSSSMENTLEINDRVLINKIVYHLRPIHRGDIVVFDGTGSWDPDNVRSGNIFSKAADELEGIVGISHDSSIYIKRVIGLPGDHVKCCNRAGQLTVNGTPLHETGYLYPQNQPSAQNFSITVPAGRLWVMGDHRGVSYDSRGHMEMPGGGTIPESAVLGRAFVIIWPPSRWGFLNIPATFEEPKLNAPPAQGGNAAAGGSSAALEAALDNGTPVVPATSPLPLALGFIGAIPVTWLRRRARDRLRRRRN
jgi:signal peptidase I